MARAGKLVRAAEDALHFEDEFYSYSDKGPRRKAAKNRGEWVGIVETLYSEHRYILSLLEALEKESAKLRPGKVPDYHLLLDIVDYLVHFPDQYHHPREDLLFAQLLQKEKSFQASLDRLQREHATLHDYNSQLFNDLSGIVAGARADRPELLGRFERYLAGYHKHIEFESREIFPLAHGTLSAADLKKIDGKTRYLDDPLFGAEVQHRYQRLGRSLQARLGSTSQEIIAREFSAMETGIERVSNLIDGLGDFRSALGKLTRDSLREQADTVKAHLAFNKSPNVVFLPAALARNHWRMLEEGVTEIKHILNREAAADD